MKKALRKLLSVERRDLWDGSLIYDFYHLSVGKLKHMLSHVSKKDRKIRGRLEEALEFRRREKTWNRKRSQ